MESQIKGVKKGGTNSRCPSYRESNKGSKLRKAGTNSRFPSSFTECQIKGVKKERVDCNLNYS